MGQHLVLTLRLHGDGQGTARFHGTVQGTPEWPPAPARVFQALVAGVARGNHVPANIVSALEWLESLPPPTVVAPHRVLGQRLSYFVPNNDADSLVDPRDISGVRTGKVVHPSLFSAEDPFLYVWPLSKGLGSSDVVVEAAANLYQLGRGVDPAWAVGEVLDDEALDARLRAHRVIVHLPERGTTGSRALACPAVGSIASLLERHRAPKLRLEGSGKKARILFTNPPKARFASVSYERARDAIVFELRDAKDQPWPWALERVAKLVERLRDEAAARLRVGLPELVQDIERTLMGRKSDGRDGGSIEDRIRIVPLPSIGSLYADQAIRRFLLEIPSGAPLSRGDIEWAFSGVAWTNPETGEVPWTAVRSDDPRMLDHYTGPSRVWRSVTAVALPEAARRRRIDPARKKQESKGSEERRAEEDRAVAAVHVALRQAGIQGVATRTHVQREPFDGHGKRAETFAEDTRFAKERLWHVEIELDRMIQGPLVIGDGRFLGLGVMAPVPQPGASTSRDERGRSLASTNALGIFALQVIGQAADDPNVLSRALRRAVMARVQAELGGSSLDTFFTGHEKDGRKAEAEGASHLAFQWDKSQQRLLIIAPHKLEQRDPSWKERQHLKTLERALGGLVELRAGVAGRFGLVPASMDPEDALIATSKTWISLVPYAVNRHLKRATAKDTLSVDILRDCRSRGFPRPEVTVLDTHSESVGGLQGRVRLDFSTAVGGPVVLGRTRYLGGGLFVAKVDR